MAPIYRAITVLTIGFFIAARLCADTPTEPSNNSVLLLHNGNVVSGEIQRDGDYYSVTLRTGEIKIRAEQVELTCNSIEEGYQRKHAAIQDGSAGEHLELARWCLRQRLFQQAHRELQTARKIEPDHPRIAVIERYLAMTETPSSPSKGRAKRSPPIRRTPSRDQLETIVRSLPEGVLEDYTTTVQPLLLRHCANAGCHSPGGDNHLRLERMPTQRHARRRPTLRNLHAVLKLVEPNAPDRSPLLTYPIRSHGGVDEAVFSRHNANQYQHLVAWVQKLSGGETVNISVESLAANATKQSAGLSPPGELAPAPTPLATNSTGRRGAGRTNETRTVLPKLRQPLSVIPVNFEQSESPRPGTIRDMPGPADTQRETTTRRAETR